MARNSNPRRREHEGEIPRHHRLLRDALGRYWICPDGVDPDEDLEAQGCWRCGDRLEGRTDEKGEGRS